jgi:drug/metabolite transporter (DMT)-like permease
VTAILLFGVVGILNFPLGRFFNYLSISHLGVGRSTPILASAPLFAMVLAVIFTGETISAGTIAGTALILTGLYVTVRAPAASRRANADD